MNYNDLFNLIKHTEYKEAGLHGNYKVIVNDNEKTIYVLFQETKGWKDWFCNILYCIPHTICMLNFLPFVPKFHFGTWLIFKTMKNEIFADFDHAKREHPDYEVISAGWSHGGGHADYFALYRYRKTGLRTRVITFGGLRVAGNLMTKKKFLESFAEGSHKFENGSDFVPRLPFRFMGFRDIIKNHIGEKFSWFKFWKVADYHTAYGDKGLYE